MNESVYYNVDEISDAISRDRQIRFHYFEYTISKQRRYRKEGAFYVVSPLALMWDNENYYLLAWDAKAALRKHYRVDKMTDISALEVPREGAADAAPRCCRSASADVHHHIAEPVLIAAYFSVYHKIIQNLFHFCCSSSL